MRYYLISDNVDTIVGMRLAGIDGVLVHETAAVQRALREAIEDVYKRQVKAGAGAPAHTGPARTMRSNSEISKSTGQIGRAHV